jgi:heme/copper-type cytochrome/quinol oxidase subunit 2
VVHESKLEIIWTCLPALFLVLIAIPSFSLLYSVDEIVEPWLIFKVIGHQWYWSYEFLTPKLFSKLYSDINSTNLITVEENTNFDSYILAIDDIPKKLSFINKLIVDNHLYLPTKVQLRAIITSTDVLHCWAVPSLGIKLDACPGRLNQRGLFINNQGFYYGQCSEICGVNHGFIPIGIVGINFYMSENQSSRDFDPLLSIFFEDNSKDINL